MQPEFGLLQGISSKVIHTYHNKNYQMVMSKTMDLISKQKLEFPLVLKPQTCDIYIINQWQLVPFIFLFEVVKEGYEPYTCDIYLWMDLDKKEQL